MKRRDALARLAALLAMNAVPVRGKSLPEVSVPEMVVYKSGDSVLNVYRSQYAGTNEATAVTWPVGDDIEDIVRLRTLRFTGNDAGWGHTCRRGHEGGVVQGP